MPGARFSPDGFTEKGAARAAVIREYLREKWGDPSPLCPYCRTNEWSVDPSPVVLQRVGGPNPGFGAPSFIVHCDNCGNQVFLPADSVGLWDALDDIEPADLGLTEEQYAALAGKRPPKS